MFQFKNAYPVFNFNFFEFTHIHQIFKLRRSTPCVTILLREQQIGDVSRIPKVSGELNSSSLNMQSLYAKPPIPLFILIPFRDQMNTKQVDLLADVNLLANFYWIFFDYDSNEFYLPLTLQGKSRENRFNPKPRVKSPSSHVSIAPVFKIDVQLDPNQIIVTWKKFNQMWSLDIYDPSYYAEPTKQERECDILRNLQPRRDLSPTIAAKNGETAIGYYEFAPGKNWGDFVMIYNSANSYDMLISVLENRWRFEPERDELRATMWGYLTSFDSIVSSFMDDEVGRFEQSGIVHRFRDEIQGLKTVYLLKQENQNMRFDKKQRINFYTAVSQLKSLVSQFSHKKNEEIQVS
ncbi:unnamed protein product [Orchesella dallaii]|uniref:Uncharacterized protein n=1 Tax=Orchesella dallaii TaxID=48710 RepID=A0ABP1QDX9_9HEXA